MEQVTETQGGSKTPKNRSQQEADDLPYLWCCVHSASPLHFLDSFEALLLEQFSTVFPSLSGTCAFSLLKMRPILPIQPCFKGHQDLIGNPYSKQEEPLLPDRAACLCHSHVVGCHQDSYESHGISKLSRPPLVPKCLSCHRKMLLSL